MKNRIFIVLLVICSFMLFFTACADTGVESDASSQTVSSASRQPQPMYTARLLDESIPYVLSNMPMSMDDPFIGTKDDTLSFPVYHDKYGSYFMGKRGGYFYYNEDKDIRYIGLMMEDGQVRYFNDNIYHNGYDNLDLWEGYTQQTQPWEKFYFFGCITEQEEIDTLSYMITMIDCHHPERGLDLDFYDGEWGISESNRNIIYQTEDELLDYLMSCREYEGCEKILSYFGRKCIYNPYTDTYTFAYLKSAGRIEIAEIHNWQGNGISRLTNTDVLVSRKFIDITLPE